MTQEILKKIRHQLAYCMAVYGDKPDELMFKLESLVIEWYEKGLTQNPDRAIGGISPSRLHCPHCRHSIEIYHFEWSALTCPQCKADIKQEEWSKDNDGRTEVPQTQS